MVEKGHQEGSLWSWKWFVPMSVPTSMSRLNNCTIGLRVVSRGENWLKDMMDLCMILTTTCESTITSKYKV